MKKTAKSFNFRNRRTNKRRIAGAPGHGFALKPIASLLGTLPAGLLLGMHTGAIAGPAGGNIAAGTGTITAPDTTTTVVNQQSHNLTVNWDSFNLATNERVQFKQPSTQSQALNRIFDQNPSQIHGRIDANGKVLLVNPSGIFFGPTARVNVGALVASGLPVSEQDLNRDKYQFNAPVDAEGGVVVNQGMLQAATGGSVNLIGGAVKNEGMILATAGQVNLGAGRRATIDFDGDGLVQFSVDQQILDNAHALDEAVGNSGEINADGGSVLLTAEVAQEVFSHAVNNSGIISAGRIQNEGGQIKLVAAGSGGALINTGTLDASSKDGDGGRIEIDAATGATLADNAAVTATSATDRGGHVQITADTVALIDAATVDVSGDRGGGTALIGGDYQGGNPDVKNAKLTYVGEDATIKADAIRDGDGGRLIVWADERSYYYSRTGSARGGADSGDGGFAEVSGREYLDFQGLVDLRAPEGEAGSLLLDPTDITICDGDVTGCSTGGLTLGAVIQADSTDPASANLSDDDLNAQLMMGNVEVNAAVGGGSGMGDILVDNVAAVDGSSSVMPGTNNDLTLTAARNITIDGTIQNVENLTFTAGTAAGDITINGMIQMVENLILNLGGMLSGRVGSSITGTGTPTSSIQGGTDYLVTGGANQGTVNGITFSNVANLMGSSGNDTFNIASSGSLTGSLDGLGGTDTLSGDAINDVALTGSDGDGFAGDERNMTMGMVMVNFSFDGINTLMVTGGTLTGQDLASTWMLDGDPTYNVGVNTLTFGGFDTLQGGGDADMFTISADSTFDLLGGGGNDRFNVNATLDGMVMGGTGTDRLSGTAINDVGLSGFVTNGFAGTEGDIMDGFDGIDTLVGNGGTLTGENAARTWTLDGTETGNTYTDGTNTLSFGGFDTLQGGNDNDMFIITADSAFNLRGSAGDDTFDVDAPLTDDPMTTATTGEISGGTGADTLMGDQIDNVILTGSTTAGGFIGTEDSISVVFNGINTLVGTGGTLTGRDLPVGTIPPQVSTWMLDGTPTGNTYNDGSNTLNFGGFATLQGGIAADTFTISADSTFDLRGGDGVDDFTVDARLTGDLDGEAGDDTLDGSRIDAVTLDGSDGDGFAGDEADITGGFDGIATLTGNGGTLTGRDLPVGTTPRQVSTWGLDGTPTGNTYNDNSNTLNFGGFDTLQGGSGANTFTISAMSAFNLRGGDDEDTFDVNAALTGDLIGGDGNDRFNVDATLTGMVIGGDGTDRLSGTAINDVDLSGFGTNGFAGTEGDITGGFDGIDTLTGTGGTLTGETGARTWTLDGTETGNTYTDGTNTLNFGGFATLEGGGAVDTFTIRATSTFDLLGMGGNDTFNINAALTGMVSGGDGADTFNLERTMPLVDAVLTGAISGGAGANIYNLNSGGSLTGGIIAGDDNEMFNVNADYMLDLDGLGGNDTFNVNAALTGRVIGGPGNNIYNLNSGGSLTGITAGDDNEMFNVNAAYTLDLDGLGGNDTFNVNATLRNGERR